MYRQDFFLVTIFFITAISIIVKSYFNLNGLLSPDSTSYLELAQNLLQGNGYYVSASGNTGQDREFFATWPIGYPTFIFLTAKLTGFSVFWASKFFNIFLVGAILIILRILFKNNAYLYGLIFLFSSYIEIFSYTWSETLFIFALLCFASALYFFIKDHKRIFLLYILIISTSLLLFISKYIGAFSFIIIAFLGFYYGLVKKNTTKALILLSIAIINFSIMVFYLYHNYAETGFITGMERIVSPETNLQLVYMLLRAIIAELLIPIQQIKDHTFLPSALLFFGQFSILSFLLFKYRNKMLKVEHNTEHKSIILSLVFFAIGLFYLMSLIVIRWISHFDEFYFRLLSPGSFLIFIGIIHFILKKGTKDFVNAFKNFLIFFAVISFLLNVPFKVWRHYPTTYYDRVASLKEYYKDIEKNSICIYCSRHINYLFTDIQRRTPYCIPYNSHKENWKDFLQRIDPENKKTIYLNVIKFVPESESPGKICHRSVVDFIEKYFNGENRLIKLK